MVKKIQALPDSDYIHLQEVWLPRHQSFLVQNLDGHKLLFNSRNQDNIGLFSISRKPITHKLTHVYTANSQTLNPIDWVREWIGVGKGFGYFQSQWGKTRVHNYNTHLHPTSSAVRGRQLLELAQHIAQLPENDAILIAGDFNTHSLSDELTFFIESKHLNSVHVDECTYCDSNPHYWGGGSRTIDHIFYRNLQLIHAEVNLKTQENLYLSDHYGVRAWFDEI